MRVLAILFCGLFAAGCAVNAPVSGQVADSIGLIEPWAIRTGLGFTLDPDNFLMAFDGHRPLHQNIDVGPLLQIGVSDRKVIVKTSWHCRPMIRGLSSCSKPSRPDSMPRSAREMAIAI